MFKQIEIVRNKIDIKIHIDNFFVRKEILLGKVYFKEA